ncbi:hypothetical protein GEMRC1_002007 [Eukaryota sp. GEM-RC1]
MRLLRYPSLLKGKVSDLGSLLIQSLRSSFFSSSLMELLEVILLVFALIVLVLVFHEPCFLAVNQILPDPVEAVTEIPIEKELAIVIESEISDYPLSAASLSDFAYSTTVSS